MLMKVAALVLADTETHGDMGRIVNALEIAKESQEAGDEVQIVFDGAGTKWVRELSNADHDAHGLYQAVRESVKGACKFCADAYGVREAVEEEGIELLDDYDDHPSVRSLLQEGYQVLTF